MKAVRGETVRGLQECYLRKAEAENVSGQHQSRKTTGQLLDMGRLAEILVARRTGSVPRVFQEWHKSFQPVFDPRCHCVVIAFDLHRGSIGDPAFSHRILGIMIEAYSELGIDVVVLGSADYIVEIEPGKRFYVHAVARLKNADEGLKGAFANRLISVIEHPPLLPIGVPACCAPLLLRSVEQAYLGVADDYSYRTLILAAPRGMPKGMPEFSALHFLSRTANAIDSMLDQIERRFEPAIFDHQGCFIPPDVKTHARPGGRASRMY